MREEFKRKLYELPSTYKKGDKCCAKLKSSTSYHFLNEDLNLVNPQLYNFFCLLNKILASRHFIC